MVIHMLASINKCKIDMILSKYHIASMSGNWQY